MSGSGISWAICKSASHSIRITTPVPHHSFFTGWIVDTLPVAQPTASKHWRQIFDTYNTDNILCGYESKWRWMVYCILCFAVSWPVVWRWWQRQWCWILTVVMPCIEWAERAYRMVPMHRLIHSHFASNSFVPQCQLCYSEWTFNLQFELWTGSWSIKVSNEVSMLLPFLCGLCKRNFQEVKHNHCWCRGGCCFWKKCHR